MEFWSIGVLEYWSAGVLECWSAGVLGVTQTEVYKPHLRQHSDIITCLVNVIEHP